MCEQQENNTDETEQQEAPKDTRDAILNLLAIALYTLKNYDTDSRQGLHGALHHVNTILQQDDETIPELHVSFEIPLVEEL